MYWVVLMLPLCLGGEAVSDGSERVLRAYDISFLVREVPQFPAAGLRASAGKLLLEVREPEGGGELFFLDEGPTDGTRVDPETLVSVIRQNLHEDSWSDTRSSIEISGGELLVVQTPEVHDAIARFLGTLRARRARMFRVDVALVPASVVADVPAADLPWIPAEVFETVPAGVGERGTRIILTAYNEQTLSGFSGRRRARILDSELNCTGVIPVMNPVVDTLPLGVTVEVKPLCPSQSEWVRLRLDVTRLSEAGPAVKRETFFTEIESVPLYEETLETTLYLKSGRPALAGTVTREGADAESRQFAVLVRVTKTDLRLDAVSPEPALEPGPDDFRLRRYDLGLILDPLRSDGPLLEGALVERIVRAHVEPEAWRDERAWLSVEDDRFLHVNAREATHAAVRSWVEKFLEERCRMAVLEVEILEGPVDAALMLRAKSLKGGGLEGEWRDLPEGRQLKRVLRAVLVGALEDRMLLRAFQGRTFFESLETHSGGTGYRIISVPDPVVNSAGGGLTLEALVRNPLTPMKPAVELALARASVDFSRKTTVQAAAELGPEVPTVGLGVIPIGGDDSEGEEEASPLSPGRCLVWLPHELDLPSQEGLLLETTTALTEGRWTILQVTEGPSGGCGMVMARVRVQSILGEGR